jgi:hypothetical protein
MCAGCPKDEREPAESAVKAALGQAAGSWTVSLVKIGRQWSVTVDGPEIKQKTMMVPDGGIRQAIQELVRPPAAPAPERVAPPAAAPSFSAPVPSPTARPAPTPTPALRAPTRAPQPAAPMPRAPLPPTRPAPAPVPRATPTPTPALKPARTPTYPTKAGERHDRYDCQYCGGGFVVIYETAANSAQETVAVACPHCWKNSHVMVAEEAALSRDYRAEKA